MNDLVATGLDVRFGGLHAVRDVTFRARAGSVTGLIGPNGAGKTTTFNACTGFVPCRGSVQLGDRVLDGLPAVGRAQLGLGRTFQRMELFDEMTVLENVALGREMLLAGRRPWCHLISSRTERAACRQAGSDALARCGIASLEGTVVAELSTGQRRLVELARAIASRFDFLLLDEPSSGLDRYETAEFAAILEGVVAERRIGILLVEHDMALVRSLCSYLYVLDFGRLILEGPATDVLASDTLQAAYLGTEVVGTAVV